MKLDSNHHSVFLMHYHLVLVVKYRRKVINGTISERLRENFENIAPNYNITVEEWNHDGDHIHVLFKGHPIPSWQAAIELLQASFIITICHYIFWKDFSHQDIPSPLPASPPPEGIDGFRQVLYADHTAA